MDVYRLIRLIKGLKPGWAVNVSLTDMREAAECELSSTIFDYVRHTDVEIFAVKMASNWGVSITPRMEQQTFIIKRPREDDCG